MKVDTIQTSFTGGELAPALFGRTDIAQYDNACALLENFLIRPYGPVISTPGTEFINDCKYDTGIGGVDDEVKLMLHMNGGNGSSTFTDSSRYNHTINVTGATITTDYSVFGGASGKFVRTGEHSGDTVSTPDSTDWDLTTADFTIDFRTRFTSFPPISDFFYFFSVGAPGWSSNFGSFSLSLYNDFFSTSGSLVFKYTYDASNNDEHSVVWGSLPTTGSALQLNRWYHIAVVRSSATLRIYVDGTQLGSTHNIAARSIANANYKLMIGGMEFQTGGYGDAKTLDGYMDEFRFSNGIARWTGDFTPPTTQYIDPENQFDSRTYGRARLIPFVFSRDDAYIIEVGESYFRFYNDGAVVISSGTTPLEITHTYEASEIFDIQYSQINDVIYLTHPNHVTKRLTRISSNNWQLSDFPFLGGPFAQDNVIYSSGTTTLLTSATISVNGTTSGSSVTLSASANLFIPSGSTLGHKNTYWKVGATVTNGTTGLTEQGYVKITAITNPSTATATIMRNLATTAATTTWAQGSWSDVLGWPARTTFHQQRLFFARTAFQPQNVWGSKSFSYEDFALDGGADDDAIDIQLASNESNEIKWLAPGSSLLAGTYGGEYAIDSGDGSPLTPANTNVSKETSWGSEAVVPKKIGNFYYYVQRFGRKIRELFFNFDIDSYKSVDKNILSPHISDGGFVDLTYQQNPDSVLWAVCSNGTIATMTREVDQDVQGWSRQTTDGYFESIACIPSSSEPHDEVWVVAQRVAAGGNVRRYIERFKSQIVPDRQDDCFYVHSGLTYDAFLSTTTPTATSISLSATNGTSVVVTSSAVYFASDDVGQRIRAIDDNGDMVGELKITGYTSSTIVVGEVKSAFDATSYSSGEWGVSVSALSGFEHLEESELTVLADGGTDGSLKTVSNGTITLSKDYFKIHAGLPYTQKIKTLPKEIASERGTAQGKKQRINEIALKLNNSFKGFKIGGTEAQLTKVVFRDPSTPMGTTESLYTGTIPNQTFPDGYRYGSQVLIHNEEPLPMEILSIITSLETYDK